MTYEYEYQNEVQSAVWIGGILNLLSAGCFFDGTVKPTQTTTSIRQPTLRLPKPVPIQLFVCKMTACLTWQATIFLAPKWKKMSEMTTTNLYLAKKWETIHYKRAFKRYIYSKFWMFGTPPSPCSYLFTLHVPPPSTYIPFSELLPPSQQKLYGIYEFINEQLGSEKTK